MQSSKALTDIAGLDDVLCGGLPRDRIYLVQGDPGVGKTTLGLQFLMAGMRRGEKCLYITLSETVTELHSVVASHAWDLGTIELVELSAIEQSRGLESDNTLFDTSEVELHETTRRLLEHVERVQPSRVVFDSLSELRLLAQSQLRYRRQILGLKQYFADKKVTVMLLDDLTSQPNDLQLQSLAHGVIHLEQAAPSFGEDRRRLRVLKLRGVKFRGGYHDLAIKSGGMIVYPRLVAAEHHAAYPDETLSSGIPGLDQLLGGGLQRGTCTLLTGPAGAGKSALVVQFAAAAARGEKVALYLFDERTATLYQRSRSLGVDMEKLVADGLVTVRQIDPAEMSSGELTHTIREAVDAGVRMIAIDSLNGFLQSMPEEKQLALQLHEMLSYLGQVGVSTLLVMAQHGLFGSMSSPVDVSYVSDTVLLLRYFEAAGRVRKALSVVKKRTGLHEDTIRELSMGPDGIVIGRALTNFVGVLTGVPRLSDAEELEDKS